jgi:hypothetical protein
VLSAGGSVQGADSTSGPVPAEAPFNPVVPLPGDTTIPAAAASDDPKVAKAGEKAQRDLEAEQEKADKDAEKDVKADEKVLEERQAELDRQAEEARAEAAKTAQTTKSTSPRQTRSGG